MVRAFAVSGEPTLFEAASAILMRRVGWVAWAGAERM